MKIQLSDHFDTKRLLRFTLPSIAMMIFTSIYGIVDGLFVSNFTGKEAFTAVNFIMPFLMILGTFGFMLGTGGSALVSFRLGEGKKQAACETFSMLVIVSLVSGIAIMLAGMFLIRPAAALLGASGVLLDNCVLYGRVVLLGLPFFMLQLEFQSFFVTAEKPNLGLYVTVASGVANMVLDALLVGFFRWGLVGAAAASAFSQFVGGAVPLLYFARPNTSLLHLCRTHFDGPALLKTCTNGSSELMSNVSMSLVGMLYNTQLIRYMGEDGVAAYGVLMYVMMIFTAVFIGYAVGMAPVVGFHYGAKNSDELHGILVRSLRLLGAAALCMFALAELCSGLLAGIFVGYDKDLYDLTVRGFSIYSFSFLFTGFAIFGSSFFTALGNGAVSAAISFLRTLVFQTAAVLLLPLVLGADGIWISIVAAEALAIVPMVFFLVVEQKKYHY